MQTRGVRMWDQVSQGSEEECWSANEQWDSFFEENGELWKCENGENGK